MRRRLCNCTEFALRVIRVICLRREKTECPYNARAGISKWLKRRQRHSQDRSRPGGVDFLRSDLLEISLVAIPALSTALIDAQARGVRLKPLERWAERLLDGGGTFRGVRRPAVEAIYRACGGRMYYSPATTTEERRQIAEREQARSRANLDEWNDELRRRLLGRFP